MILYNAKALRHSPLQLVLALLLFISSVSYAQLPDFTQLAETMSKTVVNVSAFHTAARGQGVAYGSGFVYSKDGYIITNNHVTAGASSLLIRFNDRFEIPAIQVGADELTDLALLKIDPTGLTLHPVQIGDSENLKVGQWVAAIGSPFTFDYTLTAGVVSALGRSLPNETYVPYIQSDVAVNEGNSGGPLFDLDGNVIGINSKIFSQTGAFAGLSFSIPIHVATFVVEQLREEGVVTRGWLGVSIRDVPRHLVKPFGLDRAQGALIVEIFKDGPAAKAGIRDGDIITEFNGNQIILSGDLPVYVGLANPESVATVKVIREGKLATISVKLGKKTSERVVIGAKASSSNGFGLGLINLTDQEAANFGLSGAVAVQSVKSNSLAARAGIVVGDIITHVYQTRIQNSKQFYRQLSKYQSGEAIPVRVIRNQRFPLFLALTIP